MKEYKGKFKIIIDDRDSIDDVLDDIKKQYWIEFEGVEQSG